mgnify:FL=1
MGRPTDFLTNTRRIIKLYESMLRSICEKYRLTLLEATILSFLHNNPGVDTAADITELRMLSKGNVSQAVESLIQKGLLLREQDGADRRRIHLHPTTAAAAITVSLEEGRRQFQAEVFCGLSPGDLELYDRINHRIAENTENAMARRDGT